MTTTTADVAIVGAGVEGLSVAWALTAHGVTDVILFDRGAIGSGFTSRSSGIVRCHYGVASIAAMAWSSLPLIEAAAEILGTDIGFHRTGYVVIVGEENVAPLRANITMQQGLGIDTSLIGPDEVAQLFPGMRVDDVAAAAYEPRGGYADAYSTAQALSQAVRRLGGRLRQGTTVLGIETTGSSLALTLADGDRLETGTVVVAAGPWTAGLVAPLGVRLPMKAQREQLMIVDPGVPIAGVPAVSDLVALQYLRREGAGHLLVGNSDHGHPEWVEPDSYVDSMDDHILDEAINKFSHRFPTLDAVGLVTTYAGCYDVTPDYNPVIGPTAVPGLHLCAGFSGHGFKIAPAVGQLMADIILSGDSTTPDVRASDFRLNRFDEGTPLVSPHPYAGAPEMR